MTILMEVVSRLSLLVTKYDTDLVLIGHNDHTNEVRAFSSSR